MNYINYIGAIVKILESPKPKFIYGNILVTKFRVQLPRTSQVITLTIWGNLARNVAHYYIVNDFILIEGYLSLPKKPNQNLKRQINKRAHITVSKVYPFLLSSNRSSLKTSY